MALHRDELKLGLFAAKNVSKGTVLCINTGCILDKTFWDYSDYDISYIRLVLTKLIGNSCYLNELRIALFMQISLRIHGS